MKKLRLDQITTDDRLQHRKLDVDHINSLLEAVEAGAKLPPVKVVYDGKNYWLFDGHHRLNVARIRKEAEIEAEVYQGDFRMAWEASLGVNDKHGLRRTDRDIHNVLAQVFLDADLSKLNDEAIARRVGCHRHTVMKFRHALQRKAAADAAAATEFGLNKAEPGEPASGKPNAAAAKAARARTAFFELSLALQETGQFDHVKDALKTIRSRLEEL